MMDTQVWIQFIKENWLVIVVALIVLFVVINLVKTVIKWLIVILIVVGLFIYSGITLDQIKDTVNLDSIGAAVGKVTDDTVAALKEEAGEAMLKEAQDAKYISNGDGTFTIESPNLEVRGAADSDKVQVTFRGISLGEWSINDTMNTFVKEAKQHSDAGAQ